MVFANGYNATYNFNFDSLGLLYIGVASVWTVILLGGISFLLKNRDLTFLRVRNIPLSVGAVATLHVYWVLCFLAYVLQAFFPCTTEYWIMSLYLPFGIALFHASNTQLLHVAGLQKKYASLATSDQIKTKTHETQTVWWKSGWLPPREDRATRTLACIMYALVVQLMVAVAIFVMSAKFHPNFGIAGTSDEDRDGATCLRYYHEFGQLDCEAASRISCRTGWEWIPSIVWQFFWAWFYAPYLLWQLRGVQDNYGWRMQTIFCSIAGLPASPMWIIALYSSYFSTVNKYFVPPMWFTGPIFLIEAFLIFIPTWQILKSRHLRATTLDIIAEWESKRREVSVDGATLIGSRLSHKPSSTTISSTKREKRSELYTMTALESCLRTNPQQLLSYAAYKDFSGENIAFLMRVLEWKRNWSPTTPTRTGFIRRPSVYNVSNVSLRHQQYKDAVRIYASFVSIEYSIFPINLASAHLKPLKAHFEKAATSLYGDNVCENSVAPFEEPSGLSPVDDIERASIIDYNHSSQGGTGQFSIAQSYELHAPINPLPDDVAVPSDFGPNAFDEAEDSIKYMVLTNTWPRFVNTGLARRRELKGMFGKYSRLYEKLTG